MSTKSIVIAGASGFIGRALIDQLLIEYPGAQITALSRGEQRSQNASVVWRSCDLFSEESLNQALPQQIDIAYYLVHSMGPTAQLDQGSFADYDVILADNFAHALSARGIRQLIYLGGLAPDDGELSLHLQSRMEVEDVFLEYNLPSTFFRAGLIMGSGGSSFQILLKLVKRLHVMICPMWTQTLTTPVDLSTVVRSLVKCTKDAKHLGRVYDLAGCKPLTYLDMMKDTAKYLGLKRYLIAVPLFTATLSRLWVSLVTNTSKNLVYPLIESLRHKMVARKSNEFDSNWQSRTYVDLLSQISTETPPISFQFRLSFPRNTVRSVQRIPVRSGQNAQVLADLYYAWLPGLSFKLISVIKCKEQIKIRFLNKITLIELEILANNYSQNRVTYKINRGLLVRKNPTARLEFRSVLANKFVIVAIHDYKPALPWFIYKYSQAVLHKIVMDAFCRYASSK